MPIFGSKRALGDCEGYAGGLAIMLAICTPRSRQVTRPEPPWFCTMHRCTVGARAQYVRQCLGSISAQLHVADPRWLRHARTGWSRRLSPCSMVYHASLEPGQSCRHRWPCPNIWLQCRECMSTDTDSLLCHDYHAEQHVMHIHQPSSAPAACHCRSQLPASPGSVSAGPVSGDNEELWGTDDRRL